MHRCFYELHLPRLISEGNSKDSLSGLDWFTIVKSCQNWGSLLDLNKEGD